MKNNNGFTLIELLAVIVVLAIVMVLATTTVLPYMTEARESAFRIEATTVIDSAESAKDLYTLGKVKINNDSDSCVDATTKKMCFTVDELITLGIYDGNKDDFDGKVLIENYNTNTPSYTLNLKKNSEFAIIGGTVKDYSNNTTEGGALGVVANWADANATCSCS